MVSNRFISGLIIASLVIVISLSFVSAVSIKSATPGVMNRSVNVQINVTLNNTDSSNITQVTITLPVESSFFAGTNGTDASSANFTNITQGPYKILTWKNLTAGGLFSNNSYARSFWFNASLNSLGNIAFTNMSVVVKHITGADTETSYKFLVNFAFSGHVKNETGGNESNANISFYIIEPSSGGPPEETMTSNILSGSDGSFTFPSINGSGTNYKLKIIKYGPAQGCVFSNSSCNATKIGPTLPDFPAMMFFPATFGDIAFEFMRPPCLNGTTFYLQPATTLRLYAHNNSNRQKFGYEVIDQAVGFPVSSSPLSSLTTVDIVVPTSRNYTVMFARTPGNGGTGFNFDRICDGIFMNDTTCPSPPISNSSLGVLTQGQILNVNQSMIVGIYRLKGCIKTENNNNSNINVTAISLKMVPWPGFVPPTRGDRGDINITIDISYNLTLYSECNATNYDSTAFAFYNISVMGAASGINYLVEIYAKNASSESDNPGTANNLAIFQNVTIGAADKNLNLTLYKLFGSYVTGAVNSSRIKINIQNSTGGAISTNLNANVKIKNPITGTISYIIQEMSSGTFYISVMNNSNWAKVMVFSSDSPPREITINLSLAETNITLVTMKDGSGVGMKKINATGGMEMINSTQLNVSMPIQMRFLRNSVSCNVLIPDDSCLITSMQAKNFNPLLALLAGKVNMEMKMTSTNVTLTFINFDMFAAKQPPMDSIMNDQATSSSSTTQLWQFGSFAPSNTYESAVIGMPYLESVINESASVYMKVPLLYDENWNVVWNKSRGDTSANLTDDFSDYNTNALYADYLTSTGIACSKTDATLSELPCYVNTTSNMMYMKIPHFSGVGPTVTGSVAAVATSTTTGSSSSLTEYWTATHAVTQVQFLAGYTKELYLKNRLFIAINSQNHYIGVVAITANSATINVSSTPQQAVFYIGDEKKFEVTGDNYYDLTIKLNGINGGNKANITIKSLHELIATSPITNLGTNQSSNQTGNQTGNFSISNLSGKTWWIVLIVVIIVVLAILASFGFRYFKKKSSVKRGY